MANIRKNRSSHETSIATVGHVDGKVNTTSEKVGGVLSTLPENTPTEEFIAKRIVLEILAIQNPEKRKQVIAKFTNLEAFNTMIPGILRKLSIIDPVRPDNIIGLILKGVSGNSQKFST